MQISSDEQLRRFEARAGDVLRSWKLTEEDWRNREKWDQYEEAVNDMLLKTSTVTAPWTIVAANNKWYARVKVLKTLVDRLSQELQYDPFADSVDRAGKKGSSAGSKKRKKKEKSTALG
jgi:polyphosphate kinase 2 (PPK2 family)